MTVRRHTRNIVSGKVHNAAGLSRDVEITADVAVIGSGPGGAMAAATLAARGAKVIVLEEGDHVIASELEMHEEAAYPRLYQEGGSRATEDLAITILQGRAVGGGTIVNWMTSLRTPERTLEIWRRDHQVSGVSSATLASHFERIERRLSIHAAAETDVNANNRVLRDGARALGYPITYLPRNTRDCENLGLCSFGCPIDAKQTAASTYLSDALASGAEVYARARVTKLVRSGARVTAVDAAAVDPLTQRATGPKLRVRAGRVVLAGGAINSPALLLRSGFAHPRLGTRTWLHPVVATVAEFDEPIEAWYGSPQSIACQTFSDRGEKIGYFIETPPIHPMLGALATPSFGSEHRESMERLRYFNTLIALTIDGFDLSEPGGTVTLSRRGVPALRYELRERNFEAFREAMKTTARIQFAAGARRVMTLHNDAVRLTNVAEVDLIDRARFEPNSMSIFSAHQMGGCAMGDDPARAVVDSRGKMHGTANLWICDGSVFPTGLGVNPMLSIYGVASLFADAIAQEG